MPVYCRGLLHLLVTCDGLQAPCHRCHRRRHHRLLHRRVRRKFPIDPKSTALHVRLPLGGTRWHVPLESERLLRNGDRNGEGSFTAK